MTGSILSDMDGTLTDEEIHDKAFLKFWHVFLWENSTIKENVAVDFLQDKHAKRPAGTHMQSVFWQFVEYLRQHYPRKLPPDYDEFLRFFEQGKTSFLSQYLKQQRNEPGSRIIYPDAVDFLERMHGLKIDIKIVTSSPRDIVEIIDRELSGFLSGFPWITKSDVRRPKPSPDGYLMGLKSCKDPDRAIALEDSPNGLAAAIAAGIEKIFVIDRNGPKQNNSVRIIPICDFGEIRIS